MASSRSSRTRLVAGSSAAPLFSHTPPMGCGARQPNSPGTKRGYPGLSAVGGASVGVGSSGSFWTFLTLIPSGVTPEPSSITSWVRNRDQNPSAKCGYRWQWKMASPMVPGREPAPNSRSAVKPSPGPYDCESIVVASGRSLSTPEFAGQSEPFRWAELPMSSGSASH